MTVVEERRAYWRATIDKQATSGMSIVDYCQGNHIKRDLFYAWRRRLKEKQPGAGGILELIRARASRTTSTPASAFI